MVIGCHGFSNRPLHETQEFWCKLLAMAPARAEVVSPCTITPLKCSEERMLETPFNILVVNFVRVLPTFHGLQIGKISRDF